MKHLLQLNRKPGTLALCAFLLLSLPAARGEPAKDAYSAWRHSGSIFLITTPEGADLPASASEDGFPALVRLHPDFFDFGQAKANGEDIRFSTSSGEALAYQIEQWDPANGAASVW